MNKFLQGIQEEIHLAASLGVKMTSGSDVGSMAHGNNAEVVGLVRRGLSSADAIRAATVNAAELLGWQADIGAVEAGKYAHLIGVHEDPLTDITALQRVQFVMKGGTVVKHALPH